MENHSYYSESPRIWWGLRIAGFVILGIILAVIIAFLFGYFVMLLWNWLMPALFGVAMITYWQAFGIIILAKLLFGSFSHRHPRDRYYRPRRRYMGRSCRSYGPDWRKWRYYDQYWKEEGEQAFDKYIEKMEGETKTE